MKRLIYLALLFALAGCQVQSSPVEPLPISTDDNPIETALPSPQPEDTPTDAPSTGEPASDLQLSVIQERFDSSGVLELVVRDLAGRLGIDVNEIQVVAIQQVDWPDAGLGCPIPGMEHAQVVTPGYLITLGVDSKTYTYHTGLLSKIVLCGENGPALLLIPVEDDIKDGIPWMPVGPIPTISEGGLITDPLPVK
jgi:hypothetical protein